MTNATPAPNDLLRAGMTALRAGERAQAQRLLKELVRVEPGNEQAWLYLAGTLSDATQQRYCLERVLALNPHNAMARKGLAAMGTSQSTAAHAAVASTAHVSPVPVPTPRDQVAAPLPMPVQVAAPAPPATPAPAVNTTLVAPALLATPAPPAASAPPAPAGPRGLPTLPMLSARYDPMASEDQQAELAQFSLAAIPPVAIQAPVQPVAPPLELARSSPPVNRRAWSAVLAIGLVCMLSSGVYLFALLPGL